MKNREFLGLGGVLGGGGGGARALGRHVARPSNGNLTFTADSEKPKSCIDGPNFSWKG
jgi:hypothetical protein